MPTTRPARPAPAPPYAISDGTACFGWPTVTMTQLEAVPAAGGWSLGGLTSASRARLADYVMADPARGIADTAVRGPQVAS